MNFDLISAMDRIAELHKKIDGVNRENDRTDELKQEVLEGFYRKVEQQRKEFREQAEDLTEQLNEQHRCEIDSCLAILDQTKLSLTSTILHDYVQSQSDFEFKQSLSEEIEKELETRKEIYSQMKRAAISQALNTTDEERKDILASSIDYHNRKIRELETQLL